MTPREGFKYGFLLRCAEEGLTAKEAEARAARGLEKQAVDGWDTVKNVVMGAPGFITSAGGWGALGLAGLGGLGGYGLAKLQESDIDPEDVQREELINAYNTQAELARRKSIMDAALAARPRSRSFHKI